MPIIGLREFMRRDSTSAAKFKVAAMAKNLRSICYAWNGSARKWVPDSASACSWKSFFLDGFQGARLPLAKESNFMNPVLERYGNRIDSMDPCFISME